MAESSNNKVLAFSHLLPHTGVQGEKVPHSQPHGALVPQSFRRRVGFPGESIQEAVCV